MRALILALLAIGSGFALVRGLQSPRIAIQNTGTKPKGQGMTIEKTAGNPWPVPASAAPYLAQIRAAELAHAMPHNLLARLLWQESRYRPEIIDGRLKSSAGALGIAQIVPYWHPGVDPLNTAVAIPYAAKYLAALRRQFGTWSKALAAYNWGPGNLSKHLAKSSGQDWRAGMPKETRDYVSQITADVPVS